MTPESEPIEPVSNVHDISDQRRDERLASEFSLVRVKSPVYMEDREEARKRTGNAERQARHRERLAEAGLVPTAVPADVLAQVRLAGGWPAWLASQSAAKTPASSPAPTPIPQMPFAPAEVLVEISAAGGWAAWLGNMKSQAEAQFQRMLLDEIRKIEPQVVERVVERPMSKSDAAAHAIGLQVARLSGWRRKLVELLLRA